MKPLLGRLKGKAFMAVCIAACVLPLVAIIALGRTTATSWLLILPCLAMHLIMMKMMPGHSCHTPSHQEKEAKKASSSLDA